MQNTFVSSQVNRRWVGKDYDGPRVKPANCSSKRNHPAAGNHLIHALLDGLELHEPARLALQVVDDRSQGLEFRVAGLVGTVVED